MVNTIDYDVKSRQYKITVVNCTEVRLQILKVSTSHRRDVGIADMYVMRLQIFNRTQSLNDNTAKLKGRHS